MNRFGKVLTSIALASALSGCVSPEVVTKRSVNDAQMSCRSIQAELVELDQIRGEARKGKTVSGANVAAAVLFWPAVIGNVSNANEAVKAANAREEVLVDLAVRRGCTNI